MSDGLVAFVLSIGIGSWVYSKMYRRTGGNNQSSLVIAGVTGVAVFIFAFILFKWLLPQK